MNIYFDVLQCCVICILIVFEGCVFGVLVEKQYMVFDIYLLMFNVLVVGCNQKIVCVLVMFVIEVEIFMVIDGLKLMSFVMEGSSSCVLCFEYNMNCVLVVLS